MNTRKHRPPFGILAFISKSHIIIYILKKLGKGASQHSSRGHWCQSTQHAAPERRAGEDQRRESGLRGVATLPTSLPGARGWLLRLSQGGTQASQCRSPKGSDQASLTPVQMRDDFLKALENGECKAFGHPPRGLTGLLGEPASRSLYLHR